MEAKKLWGGRFRGNIDPLMEKYNESFSFDKRLWAEDIQGSQAYAKALVQASVLSSSDGLLIANGLETLLIEWKEGRFIGKDGDEDIHTANERRLTELIGEVAGRLHTGRSRNDQVATDMRLYVRKMGKIMMGHCQQVLETICVMGEEYMDVLMPGFTHLQPAQPIRFSHWILSHGAAILRDAQVGL